VADREVEDALARSFLADLPAEVAGMLRAEGERGGQRVRLGAPAGRRLTNTLIIDRPVTETFTFIPARVIADRIGIPGWSRSMPALY
jgi:hypothetical protein